MLGVVLFASAISIAFASTCCVPPQWTGQMSTIAGISSGVDKGALVQGTYQMAYDAVSHKIGMVETVTINGKSDKYAILIDYNTDSRYVLNNGKCLRTRLGRTVADFGGCIPDNATKVSSEVVLGFGGNNDAKVDTYLLTYTGASVYIVVTSDACVPVEESGRGSVNGNGFIQNNYYFNITAGLSAETVANLASPPKGCENAQTVEAHYTQTFVGKRSNFGILGF